MTPKWLDASKARGSFVSEASHGGLRWAPKDYTPAGDCLSSHSQFSFNNRRVWFSPGFKIQQKINRHPFDPEAVGVALVQVLGKGHIVDESALADIVVISDDEKENISRYAKSSQVLHLDQFLSLFPICAHYKLHNKQ